MLSLFSRKVKDECSDKTTSKYLTSHSHHGYESKMLIERKRETVLKEECIQNQGPIWPENQIYLDGTITIYCTIPVCMLTNVK